MVRKGAGAAAGTGRGAMARAAHVHAADLFRVRAGANQGDALDLADASQPGDIYQLAPASGPLRLLLDTGEPKGAGAGQRIAAGSAVGQAGDPVTVLARHVMMGPDGETADLILLRHEPSGARYILPLAPLRPRCDYILIESQADPGPVRLADLVCLAFTAGTMIALADGSQRPVEALTPGTRILTRDNGPQPLRLLGRARLRAIGSFAPVVIARGTLGNAGDLIVSPHHRIFLYQRGTGRLGPTAEVLVEARHLVDGRRVWQREGGIADYYSLVFDRHEIVYAEGIPAESLLVTDRTLELLPGTVSEELATRFPGLRHLQHFGSEADAAALELHGREALFRSGS